MLAWHLHGERKGQRKCSLREWGGSAEGGDCIRKQCPEWGEAKARKKREKSFASFMYMGTFSPQKTILLAGPVQFVRLLDPNGNHERYYGHRDGSLRV